MACMVCIDLPIFTWGLYYITLSEFSINHSELLYFKAPEHRRKWDTAEYEELARKRHAEEREGSDSDGEVPKKRELLRQREYRVDLDSRLGKSTVITKNTPASQAGGYYCNVCVCVVKDSINFLDHINGKKRTSHFREIYI